MDSAPKTKPKKSQRLRAIIPMVWELVRPRRALLAIGFGLMVINRVSGLVLPYSTKFLIDTVIVKRHLELLKPLILLVLGATIVQGITSFSLTQLLSRSEEHTSELQSPDHLVCRLLLEKRKTTFRLSLM